MKKLMVALTIVAVQSGCIRSITLDAIGRFEDSAEIFIGTATGYPNGSGSIRMTSKLGVVCVGEFVYTTTREGSGVLSASDGRVGKFTFVSTGSNGTGTGDLGGKRFIFTFGYNLKTHKTIDAVVEKEQIKI